MKRPLVVLFFAITTIVFLNAFGIEPPAIKAQAADTSSTKVTTTVPAPTTTTTLVPASIMEKWNKVSWCETHSHWHHYGSRYDGGLGIATYNWAKFGGTQFAAAAHLATPEQQVVVARRIQAHGGVPEYVPDQNGSCSAW
jgi:Transglycosylase-like domain